MLLSGDVELGVVLGMSAQVVLTVLLSACALVALLLWRIWCSSCERRKHEKMPPAPPALPVLGHLHLLGKLPHCSLAKLARQYGPHLMSLRIGSVPFLIASSPQAAKLILHTHDHIFGTRPQTAAFRHIAFNNSSIAFCPTSPYWRRMRGLCASDLFSIKRIRSFRSVRRLEMHALLRSVFANRGQEFAIRPMLIATSLNMMSRMAIGKRLSELAAENKTLYDISNVMDEVFHLLGVFHLGDYFPFLARFDLLGHERRMKVVGRRLSTAMQVVLDMHRAATRKGEDKSLVHSDLLDVLLAMPDIEDDNAKALITDMLLGGADTTSTTIEWVLSELLANPTTLTTLQDELDQVVGKSRLVEEEDISNLPYLEAVVKESLRLHPPGPLLLPHESNEVCQIGDYIIQSKTRVLVNMWAIGRDPIAWENSLNFEPNRFMEKGRNHQATLHGQHFEFIPFGSGKRRCPGLNLGLLTVQIVVALLLQCFDLSSRDPIDLSESFGLVVAMASPLTIDVVPRIDFSLYQTPM